MPAQLWSPGGAGSREVLVGRSLSPPNPLPSGQKFMTKVVKMFGPLSRNYYIRAFLHLG